MPARAVIFLSGAGVLLAEIRLARAGNIIAEQIGLGSAWIGAAPMAVAAVLPQFLTDFLAVQQGHVSLAADDLVGSNVQQLFSRSKTTSP